MTSSALTAEAGRLPFPYQSPKRRVTKNQKLVWGYQETLSGFRRKARGYKPENLEKLNFECQRRVCWV
jgi:hypothetical protein